MSPTRKCPQCSAELPAGAPEGLCPTCLMAAGLESQQGSASAAPTTPHLGSFVPPSQGELSASFPQLEILELLGHGGMGAVYKARQIHLDRLVALKIIRPESASAPGFSERFSREAKTLGRLNHPHIVAIYDFGKANVQSADGSARPLYYFVMEYVDGTNLRTLIQEGSLKPQEALAIVPQVCEALQYAHDEGVVHRDIKPENILIDKRGRVKIADFGLAKLVAQSPDELTLTGTHQVMGTPRYMAPEQMEGSHAVDHRADIYSLGVVFYELLTGEVPAGHFDPPSKKVEVDVRLDDVVLRSLAREPERRYQQASEVSTDVRSISTTPRTIESVSASSDFTWSSFASGLGMLLPVLGLIAFAMHWTGSAWPLAILALLWFLFGLLFDALTRGDKEMLRIERELNASQTVMFVASIALLGYGIAVTDSLSPLWAAVGCFLGYFGSGTVYKAVSTAKEEEANVEKQSKKEVSDVPITSISDRKEGASELTTFGWADRPFKKWIDWLMQRDVRVIQAVQSTLAIVFLICLFFYNGVASSSKVVNLANGERLRNTTLQFGLPSSPWSKFESNPNGKPGWNWQIYLFSWSHLVILAGFAVWGLNWRIEKARAKLSGKQLKWWHGSPRLAYTLWGLIVITEVALGILFTAQF